MAADVARSWCRTEPRLLDRFELHVIAEPEALAYVQGVESLVRAELWLAAGLVVDQIRSSVGAVRRVVVVHLPDSLSWLVMFLAVLRAGHVPARLPTAATPGHLLQVLEQVKPAMVISAADSLASRIAPGELEAACRKHGVAVAHAEAAALRVGTQDGTPLSAPVPEDLLLVAFNLDESGSLAALIHTEVSLATQNRCLVDRYAPSRQVPVVLPCPLGADKSIVDAACLAMYSGAPIVNRESTPMRARGHS